MTPSIMFTSIFDSAELHTRADGICLTDFGFYRTICRKYPNRRRLNWHKCYQIFLSNGLDRNSLRFNFKIGEDPESSPGYSGSNSYETNSSAKSTFLSVSFYFVVSAQLKLCRNFSSYFVSTHQFYTFRFLSFMFCSASC